MENSQKNVLVPVLVVVIVLAVVGIGIFEYKRGTNPAQSPLDMPLSTTTPPIEGDTSTPSQINNPAPTQTTPTKPATVTKPAPAPVKKPAAFVVSSIAFEGSSVSSKNPSISWNTSVPTKTKIFYDKDAFVILLKTAEGEFQSASHGFFVINASYSTGHLFEFPNLNTSTLYYYAIESLDQSGNSIVTTGSFTTPATKGI